MDFSNNMICDINRFHSDSGSAHPFPNIEGLSSFISSILQIKSSCRIKKLNFSHNELFDEGIRIIADLLSSSGPHSLQELILKNCHGGDKSAKYIARYLEQNRSLTVLDLNENELGSDGVRHIALCLSQNKKLLKLFLNNNYITHSNISYVTQMMLTNSTLCVLTLGGNIVGDHGAEVFANSFRYVETLTHLDLQNNLITSHGANALLNGIITCLSRVT